MCFKLSVDAAVLGEMLQSYTHNAPVLEPSVDRNDHMTVDKNSQVRYHLESESVATVSEVKPRWQRRAKLKADNFSNLLHVFLVVTETLISS